MLSDTAPRTGHVGSIYAYVDSKRGRNVISRNGWQTVTAHWTPRDVIEFVVR